MDTTIADPLVGRRLDGRYLIEARVARGGMASVYLATDERLDRPVAVKVMSPSFAESADFVRRFIREAQSAARLSHPNVVNVFDQGRDGDIVFLVMEYVEGRTLRDVLKAAGRLTPGQTVAVLEPIVAALAAAHRAGIVHRDIKPENVLMADDGRVKVADFGLARAIESSTITMTQGSLIGSPAYLAPEQVERGVADQRADVYALGTIAFELLTGRPPFTGEVAVNVAWQHVHDDVPAPSTVVAGVPAVLDAFVVAATRRNPDVRPVDGGALVALLAEVHRVVPAEPLQGPAGTGDTHHTVVLPGGSPADAPGVGSGQTGLLGPPPPPVAGDPREPREPRQWRKGWIWFVIVMLIAAAAAAYGVSLARSDGNPHLGTSTSPAGTTTSDARTIKMPDFTSAPITLDAATNQAAGLNLTVRLPVPGEFSRDVPKDDVLRQDPAPGTLLAPGDSVTLTVSNGPAAAVVPDLARLRLADAESRLTKAALTLSATTLSEYSSTIAAGLVVRSVPPKGAAVHEGDPIELVLSNGPEMLDVPDERTQTQDSAVAALKTAGFAVVVKEVYSDTVTTGVVVGQQPAGGQLAKGKTVTLTVSKGPQYFTLDNYKGRNADLVAQALRRDFGVIVHVERPIGGGPGTVLAQTPSAGTKVKHGDTVRLFAF